MPAGEGRFTHGLRQCPVAKGEALFLPSLPDVWDVPSRRTSNPAGDRLRLRLRMQQRRSQWGPQPLPSDPSGANCDIVSTLLSHFLTANRCGAQAGRWSFVPRSSHPNGLVARQPREVPCTTSLSDVSDVTMWTLLTPTLERFWNWSLPAGNAFDVRGRGQNRCFAVTTAEKTSVIPGWSTNCQVLGHDHHCQHPRNRYDQT